VLIITFVFLRIVRLIRINSYFTFTISTSIFLNENLRSFIVFLRIIIIGLSILCTWWIKKLNYLYTLLSLNIFLIIAFSVKRLISFYFFFEASLIPTLILIIVWGYQPERLQAGRYIILYTVFASLPLLVFLLYLYFDKCTSDIYLIKIFNSSIRGVILLVVILAFLVKLPVFRMHLWLPKAHVEAPLRGSIILAGILLKLGGYGLYLINFCFRIIRLSYINILVRVGSLWGGLMATFICIRQVDVKAMVAYSSVAHISLVVAGIMLNSNWGIVSSKITIVAHGFTSSALFVLANIRYKKVSSRRFNLVRGMLSVYPKISILWFIFCRINIAAPPSINLLGELRLIPSLYLFSWRLIIIIGLLMFFRAGYNILLYTISNHGASNNLVTPRVSYLSSDFLGLWLHLFPFWMLFKISLFFI